MPKTLLLADDSVTIQKVVGITFANEDVELVTVDNGADAVTRARELKPDLIMADVAMPGLGGYELCATIRRDPELAGIPVLLLTGTFESYDEQKGQSAGASGHIAKPFEAQTLIGQFYALVDQDQGQAGIVDAAQAPAAPQPGFAPVPPQTAPTPVPPPFATAAAVPQPVPGTPVPGTPVPGTPVPAAPAPQAEFAPVAPQTAPAPAAPQAEFAPVAPESDSQELPELPNTDFSAPLPEPPSAPSVAPEASPPRPVAPPLIADPNAVPSLPEETSPTDDFSFEDLDFNESTPASASMDTGIFGEDPASGLGSLDDSYGETAFLDPKSPLGQPSQPVSLQPDPLADTIPEDPFSDPNEDTIQGPPAVDGDAARFAPPSPAPPPQASAFAPQPPRAPEPAAPPIPEALPWSDPTPQPRPVEPPAQPIATAPEPAQAVVEPPMPEPLEMPDTDTEPLDAEPLDAEPLEFHSEPPEEPDHEDLEDLGSDFDADDATVVAPEAFAAAAGSHEEKQTTIELDEPPLFAPEPEPEVDLPSVPPEQPSGTSSVVLDPAEVRSAIEKVAWEAFGTLQEQLMREVVARTEAAIWEIVPQIAERLIREEIERLKSS